jgi:lipoprotein-anchoring transpeptidase ErfK/SrfK
MTTLGGTRRRRAGALLAAAGLAAVLAAGGCTDDGEPSSPGGGATEGPSIDLAVTPADKATDVPVSVEIGVKAGGGKVTKVELADAGGRAVEGAMRDDATSWVPAEPLEYTTTYTATVTAQPDKGDEVRRSSTFTTMRRPGNRIGAHVYMADNATYGQAMPVVVEFRDGGVPAQHRAAVERRLFVRSDPPQEGAWHWDSDIQVEYRPREYWQPGTKLDVRLGLGGLPIGDRFGQVDITIVATIDSVRRLVEVDNATKRLTATQDGRQVRTAPVSLGKPSAPSVSGTMVIMEKLAATVFDSSTYGTPVDSPDGYRTKVKFAERLTWDGQFIHAAPWSVAAQGRRNVSHGCVNLSPANGQWLYGWLKIGDPVVVKGTGARLKQGNGWTVWDLSWDEVLAGSALHSGAGASPGPSPS